MKINHSSPEHHRVAFKLIWIIATLFIVLLGIAIATLFLLTTRLQGIVSQKPSYTAQDLYRQAQEQIDHGSYAPAEQYLEQALLKQDDATYRSQLAVVKYRLKKYSEAVDQYQKLVDQHQDVAFAYNGMGNAYRDWADADPTHATLYRSKAEASYRQAITNDPHYVAAYSNLALLLDSQGKRADALPIIAQGLAQTADPTLQQLQRRLTSQ